ncbi:MAG: hypothetical protein PHY16_08825 [Methylobacter sp.]|nr:hypothetical protein [Methylobacter sp.]
MALDSCGAFLPRTPMGVNANPLLADWSGANLSGTDWHLPEGWQAGEPDMSPCRYDGA